jgi:hypothetical protein
MEFDNASFERRICSTLASLDKLDKALQFKDAGKGFDDISKSAGRFDISHIASAVEHIASKFSILGAVGFSAIQSITQAALGMAKKIGGDILGPIITGGTARAKNIEQAKFMFQGLGIDVEKGMDSALAAVKGTAFGLDEAAKAAAQFGASGIKVGDEMTGALKGVAGAAAMTGSSFTEMADIFAGSAGTGKVTNMDLMQFATRGLNAAAAIGKVLGKTEAQVHAMATAGTLDFKTFAGAMNEAFGAHATEANKTYTGALSNLHAAMSRLGEAFIGPRLTQQRDLFNSLSPAVDKVTKALKPLFNTIHGIMGMMNKTLINNINSLDFSPLRKAVPFIQKGLLNIFDAFGRILNVGKKAFRDIFPASFGSVLVTVSALFAKFTEHLLASGQTLSKIRRIFDGFFAVLSIGWTILKEGAKFIAQLVTSLTGLGSGGILEFAATIGDFFTQLQNVLVKGGGIKDFFKNLTKWIKDPIPYLKDAAKFIGQLFTGFDPAVSDKIAASMGRLGDRFSSLKRIFDRVGDIWRPFQTAMEKIFNVLDTIWGGIRDWFAQLGHKIAAVLGKGEFNDVLDAINVGLLGGIAALIAKWMHSGINVDLTGGVMKSLTGTFNQLTNTLKTMQLQIKADAIMKIAEAIAVLVASMLVLSLIDSAALTKALTAMAFGFGELMASFAILNKMDAGIKSGAQFDLIAGGMIALSTALVIMSGAVAILGRMKPGDLFKGLAAIGVMLGGLIAASKGLEKAAPGLILSGTGLIALATGLTILAGAVALFGTMNWKTLIKGIIGITAALAGIALAMNMMPANLPLTGAGLILVATALNILAGAMKIFGTINYSEMLRGFVGIGGALVIIGVAMHAMPITLPITAAGLVLVSLALVQIAGAMKIMGSMSWGEIGKGLATLAASMLILVVATNAMTGAIGGAIAIGIVSASLLLLAGALSAFADLSWGDLLHGLVGVAAALALLGVAALALSPVIPEMLALGAALTLLGIGFALIGVGAFAVAKAFETIAKAGKAGAEAIGGALYAIGEAIPKLLQGVAQGLVDFIMIIGKALPPLMKILGAFLGHLADTLIMLVPKLIRIIGMLIDGIIRLMVEKGPEFIAAGLGLLINLLTGIRDNIDQITTLVIEIYLAFMKALEDNMDQIVGAGVNLLVSFLLGISNNLTKIVDTVAKIIEKFIAEIAAKYVEIGTAGVNALIAFLKGITDNLIKVTNAVGRMITTFITAVSNNATRIANSATNLVITFITSIGNNGFRIGAAAAEAIVKFINGISANIQKIINAGTNLLVQFIGGIGKNITRVIDKGTEVVGKFIEGLGKNAVKLANKAGDVLVQFLNGLADAIDTHMPEIEGAGRRLAGAIVNGMTLGLAGKAADMAHSVTDAVGGAVSAGKKKLRVVGDPYSLVFMGIGEAMMNGMTMALDADTTVEDSSAGVVGRATDVFRNSLTAITDSLGDITEFNPTITPVLDLTKVQADAAKISDYIQGGPALTPSFSTAQARTIASDAQIVPDTTTSPTATTGEVKFEQNIYAPEQLSTADIYKQTRNQITLAKEELSIP